MVAEVRLQDLDFIFVHVGAHNAFGDPEREIRHIRKCLHGEVYVPEFNGRPPIISRVVATWHSEFDGSVNIAIVDARPEDLVVLQNWPSVGEGGAGRITNPPSIPCSGIEFNPNWRIVE